MQRAIYAIWGRKGINDAKISSSPRLNIWLHRVGRGSWLGSPHRGESSKFKQRPQGNHFTSVTYLRLTSQMIADRKKQGTSCHWMPSLYLLIKKLYRQIFDKFFLQACYWGRPGRPRRNTLGVPQQSNHSGLLHCRAWKKNRFLSWRIVWCLMRNLCSKSWVGWGWLFCLPAFLIIFIFVIIITCRPSLHCNYLAEPCPVHQSCSRMFAWLGESCLISNLGGIF